MAQLAQDRAELQGKLAQLEQLVKRVVDKEEVQEMISEVDDDDRGTSEYEELLRMMKTQK